MATAGPDGNVWYCGPGDVGSISEAGIITNYLEPIGFCDSIATATDGNLWLTENTVANNHCTGFIDRMTPTGQLTRHPQPDGVCAGAIASSAKDRLLWFCYETSTSFGAGTFDPVTDEENMFSFAGIKAQGCGSMNTGVDGNAYETSWYGQYQTSEIVRITPSGSLRRFIHTPAQYGYDANQQNVRTIWQVGNDGLDGWSISTHQTTSYGTPAPPEFIGEAPFLGPDMNIWFRGGVYLRRMLSVRPQRATLAVGRQQVFSIGETNCPICVWSVVSSNQSVASVSTGSSASFTVTGQSSGSATITVSDKRNNVVRVPITVNQGSFLR